MTEVLKKFWFVILISLIFVGIIGAFIIDKTNSVFKGLTIDGKDIVYAINGEHLSADEFYDSYYKQNGVQLIGTLLRTEIADKSITLTEDEIKSYKSEASKILEQYISYGYTKEMIQENMKKSGYKDWETYYVSSKKVDKIIQNYIDEHQSEYFPSFLAEKKPRVVSHILIAMSDPKNPTEEEKKRVKIVEDALASGESFDSVAFKYSEDENSRINNGSVGYVDSDNSTFVAEFKKAASELNDGDTSAWVQTKFGWHLIHNDGNSYDLLKKDANFYSAIISYYNNKNLSGKAVWEKLEQLEVTFKDESLKDKIKNLWIGDNN